MFLKKICFTPSKKYTKIMENSIKNGIAIMMLSTAEKSAKHNSLALQQHIVVRTPNCVYYIWFQNMGRKFEHQNIFIFRPTNLLCWPTLTKIFDLCAQSAICDWLKNIHLIEETEKSWILRRNQHGVWMNIWFFLLWHWMNVLCF